MYFLLKKNKSSVESSSFQVVYLSSRGSPCFLWRNNLKTFMNFLARCFLVVFRASILITFWCSSYRWTMSMKLSLISSSIYLLGGFFSFGFYSSSINWALLCLLLFVPTRDFAGEDCILFDEIELCFSIAIPYRFGDFGCWLFYVFLSNYCLFLFWPARSITSDMSWFIMFGGLIGSFFRRGRPPIFGIWA